MFAILPIRRFALSFNAKPAEQYPAVRLVVRSPLFTRTAARDGERDAASRNSSAGKRREKRKCCNLLSVHELYRVPVDAQPPIRNYSQIPKSNMAVSSCQSEIARKSEKRLTDKEGRGGRERKFRSTNDRDTIDSFAELDVLTVKHATVI